LSLPSTPDASGIRLRVGCSLSYRCEQPTPMILMLNIHYSRSSDLLRPDNLVTNPSVRTTAYRDGYGNWCTRLIATPGLFIVTTDALVYESGRKDIVALDAAQIPVESLPDETLVYLLGSRYCDTDRLSELAWKLFAHTPPGWRRVQAICDYVFHEITFGYRYARPTKTAFEALSEKQGVCRDYAHAAIALCRCMNIPARYCTGYLPDIGVEPSPADFAGWMEVYLGNDWYVFDPRNNEPRIGRVLIARGRDAADVAISTSFGPNILEGFVVTAEVEQR